MSHTIRSKSLLAILLLSSVAFPARAQQAQTSAQTPDADMPTLETVVVYARGEHVIGESNAASAGAVGGADLTTRPVLRVAQLLEVVPGLIAAQHSGSGKANQYFLRGINLDHGTDFTNYFDDVPMNFRSHGHGQGYLDVNGIIAETVQRIDYRKGPYRADVGDFALAGASYMTTVDRFDRPFATVEAGDFGHKRLVTGGSYDFDNGATLTGAVQWKTYNGPYQLKEDLQHLSSYTKYSAPTPWGQFELSLSGYYGKWQPTEQVPERAWGQTFSESGAPTIYCADKFCSPDPTARGRTARLITSARILSDDWRATLYAQYYDWHMSSNPTYYLDDPINGDQILQRDHRWIVGGRYEHDFDVLDRVTLKLGAEGRYDIITNVGVDHTVDNRYLNTISANDINEGSISPYAEVNWKPIDELRLMAGLRGDFYNFNVTSLDPATSVSGNRTSSLGSPKLGIAYELTDWLELYANWGMGMHSNDARGIFSTTPAAPLVRGQGKEAGVRFQYDEITLTAAYWWLNLNSELKFVGDSNSVEPSNPSARRGIEITGFWRPYEWLAIDGVWTMTHARFEDAPGAEYIPGALEQVGEFGVSAIFDHYEASTRIRYIGAYPLIEDNSVRAKGDMEVNFRFAWKPNDHVTVYSEILNALDHPGKDIEYLYTSRLPGEPVGGIDGILSRPEEPRTVRLGIKYTF